MVWAVRRSLFRLRGNVEWLSYDASVKKM